ncbi:hypothetical protein TNCV_5027861 [Trichonephila clavipes]|nr:hypothetical protein TNCV_5027861 [Trichonephila clavipes]
MASYIIPPDVKKEYRCTEKAELGRSAQKMYFDVKDAPRTGRLVVENVDKITKIIKADRHSRPDTKRYHLFLALQHFLSDKKLEPREDWENRMLEFFANKGQDFYEEGIMNLTLKW